MIEILEDLQKEIETRYTYRTRISHCGYVKKLIIKCAPAVHVEIGETPTTFSIDQDEKPDQSKLSVRYSNTMRHSVVLSIADPDVYNHIFMFIRNAPKYKGEHKK